MAISARCWKAENNKVSRGGGREGGKIRKVSLCNGNLLRKTCNSNSQFPPLAKLHLDSRSHMHATFTLPRDCNSKWKVSKKKTHLSLFLSFFATTAHAMQCWSAGRGQQSEINASHTALSLSFFVPTQSEWVVVGLDVDYWEIFSAMAAVINSVVANDQVQRLLPQTTRDQLDTECKWKTDPGSTD